MRHGSLTAWHCSYLVGFVTLVGLVCGCTKPAPRVDRVHVCTEMQGGRCVAHVARLDLDTATLHVTAQLQHAPKGTPVKVSWRYLGQGGRDMGSADVQAADKSNVVHDELSRPATGWRAGDYRVTVAVQAANLNPVVVAFHLAAPKTSSVSLPAPREATPAVDTLPRLSLAAQHTKLVDQAAAALDIVADKIIAAGDDKTKLAKLNEALKTLQQKLGKAHFSITQQMTPGELDAAKMYASTRLAPIAKRLKEHAAVLQANHDLKAGRLPKRRPAAMVGAAAAKAAAAQSSSRPSAPVAAAKPVGVGRPRRKEAAKRPTTPRKGSSPRPRIPRPDTPRNK